MIDETQFPNTDNPRLNYQSSGLFQAYDPQAAMGYWIAYWADWSGFAVFRCEVDALRHAVIHSMQVKHVNWGADPRAGE